MGKTESVKSLVAGMVAAEQTALTDQIAAVKSQIADLKDRLLTVTDEPTFDNLSREIGTLSKKQQLLEARERLADWESEEKRRTERLTTYQARVKRIEAIKAELAGLDDAILAALGTYAEDFYRAFDLQVEAGSLQAECRVEAVELNQEVPEISKGPVFNLPMGSNSVLEYIGRIASETLVTWEVVRDAKKKGIPVEKLTIEHVRRGAGMRFNDDGSIMKY